MLLLVLALLANSLATNAIFGSPKGIYLFVGKTDPTSGSIGQTERVVRGYSAVNAVSAGWSAISPCESDRRFVCVSLGLDLESVSIVAFDFRPGDFVLGVGGIDVASGGPAADAVGMTVPVGPRTLRRGETYSTAVTFAIPRATARTSSVFTWRDGDRTIAAWSYPQPLWSGSS